MKESKKGVLELELQGDGSVKTVRREDAKNSMLRDVYLNGDILVEDNLDAIRERTKVELVQGS